ncbi:MAG: 50S ribosomal protein L32 [Candidatus Atribacteria bacterium]|nr:50S ribosomal protein L32 [Candidatus Atribacteria bacterium]
MPMPKRKTSKSRKNKRRTHWNLTETKLTECPRCHEMKLPHRACPECGYYNGKKIVISTEEKQKKKEKNK